MESFLEASKRKLDPFLLSANLAYDLGLTRYANINEFGRFLDAGGRTYPYTIKGRRCKDFHIFDFSRFGGEQTSNMVEIELSKAGVEINMQHKKPSAETLTLYRPQELRKDLSGVFTTEELDSCSAGSLTLLEGNFQPNPRVDSFAHFLYVCNPVSGAFGLRCVQYKLAGVPDICFTHIPRSGDYEVRVDDGSCVLPSAIDDIELLSGLIFPQKGENGQLYSLITNVCLDNISH